MSSLLAGERFFSLIFFYSFIFLLRLTIYYSLISQQGKHGRSDSTKRDGCDNCAIGTASAEVSLATPCPTCPTGFAAREGEGNTDCSACLAGQFQEKNSADEMICTDCGAGQFTNSSNALKCKACDPGEYQNAEGKTACLPCIPVRDFFFVLF